MFDYFHGKAHFSSNEGSLDLGDTFQDFLLIFEQKAGVVTLSLKIESILTSYIYSIGLIGETVMLHSGS